MYRRLLKEQTKLVCKYEYKILLTCPEAKLNTFSGIYPENAHHEGSLSKLVDDLGSVYGSERCRPRRSLKTQNQNLKIEAK